MRLKEPGVLYLPSRWHHLRQCQITHSTERGIRYVNSHYETCPLRQRADINRFRLHIEVTDLHRKVILLHGHVSHGGHTLLGDGYKQWIVAFVLNNQPVGGGRSEVLQDGAAGSTELLTVPVELQRRLERFRSIALHLLRVVHIRKQAPRRGLRAIPAVAAHRLSHLLQQSERFILIVHLREGIEYYRLIPERAAIVIVHILIFGLQVTHVNQRLRHLNPSRRGIGSCKEPSGQRRQIGYLAHAVHCALVGRTGQGQCKQPVSLIIGCIAILRLIPPCRGLLPLVRGPFREEPCRDGISGFLCLNGEVSHV